MSEQEQIAAVVHGRPVTRQQLSEAFSLVANKENWKLPVDAVVDLDDWSMAVLREAVIFFTGSLPAFAPDKGAALPKCRYRVTASGYYAAVGA